MKLQQCRPFDSRLLNLKLTDRQREVYIAYGVNGSNVNATARALNADAGNISKQVRTVQDKGHSAFGTDEWDGEIMEIVQRPLKVLFHDIETAPTLHYSYPLWNVNIPHRACFRYEYVLSFAARWMGTDKNIFHRCTDGNDKPIIEKLIKLYDEADIVVGHNGKAYDTDKVKGRALKHGIAPPTPFKVADTLRIAKREFNLQRYSLEFLADFLGVTPKQPHTEFPGQELFWACDVNNPHISAKDRKRAWQILKEYNIGDLDTLEEVYYRLRPWATQHPSLAIFLEETRNICPKCGSGELQTINPISTNTMIYPGYRCDNCTGMSRGRKNISEKAVKDATLVNAL